METTTSTPNVKEQNNDEMTFSRNVSPLGDKRDVANMFKCCIRSVDNYIADGMPVIKPSPRCCRFDLPEVKAWFKTRYGQQNRRSFSKN